MLACRHLFPLLIAGACASPPTAVSAGNQQLGAFSISLAVKDLAASRAFYGKLGFAPFAGDGKSWQMLRNGEHVLGLFQGLFPRNMLTFNPGWSQQATALPSFVDVRTLQARLVAEGVPLTTQADPLSSDPASFTLVDPDGNPILFDQHVPAPTKAN
jgi:lactoylglutathione lyase